MYGILLLELHVGTLLFRKFFHKRKDIQGSQIHGNAMNLAALMFALYNYAGRGKGI